MKIRWTPLEIHNISSIYNIICNNNSNNNHNNKNKNKEFYKLLDYRQKEWKHTSFSNVQMTRTIGTN